MTDQPLALAAEYAPIIERVHGENHPEFTRLRELTEQLVQAGPATDTAPLFAELRTLTNGYVTPDDTCETVEATYQALQQLDAQASA